jgi:Family of unknown function (DUF6304)
MDIYPAKYIDTRGTESTSIRNDGATLSMTVRGVEFEGTEFDSLEPTSGSPGERLSQFPLSHNALCSCRIECEIPIPVYSQSKESTGTLSVKIILGDPTRSQGLDLEIIQITLKCEHGQFASSGNSGWFEDELLEIQSQLPEGVFMRACINCLYSDYSPYGHGAFGGMMCFRNLKAEYLSVKSKADFLSMRGPCDRMVQEIYVCPEFEQRVPGTGYRG